MSPVLLVSRCHVTACLVIQLTQHLEWNQQAMVWYYKNHSTYAIYYLFHAVILISMAHLFYTKSKGIPPVPGQGEYPSSLYRGYYSHLNVNEINQILVNINL